MKIIIIFTGSSTLLITLLGIAAVTVVLRRGSTTVVEKEIQTIVQASATVASAILNDANPCTDRWAGGSALKPLLAYVDGAFPNAQIVLTVYPRRDPPTFDEVSRERIAPAWVPQEGFSGVVVERGKLDIRNIAVRELGSCRATVMFNVPLGEEVAHRISRLANVQVIASPQQSFHIHPPQEKLLATIARNFVPGSNKPLSVVLTVRDWDTGAVQDWLAYQVLPTYSRAFNDLIRRDRPLAGWVWLLGALSTSVLLMDLLGVWMCVRLSRAISWSVDDLTTAADQIASGNFAWRTEVRTTDQLGHLACSFNQMTVALDHLQKEQTAKLRLENDIQVAQRVQQDLYPKLAPKISGATIYAKTVAARTIGGDLFDFFDLGNRRLGILCADLSGKGVSAALMMANLQAIARVYASAQPGGHSMSPAGFVEALNGQLVGRFGDSRYSTLVWAEYETDTRSLHYVNAGHPPPIVVNPNGEVARLDVESFPVGMFKDVGYTSASVQLQPGAHLVIFTDGITDAQNVAEEEFGDDRLIDRCRTLTPGSDAVSVVNSVVDAARDWAGSAEQYDDSTVIAIAVNPSLSPFHQ